MTDFPTLENWDSTRDALHQIAQVQSAVKVGGVEPQPNSLQYSLGITPTGLTTSRLNVGGELRFDIAALRLFFTGAGGGKFEIDLAGYDQKSLMDDVVECFALVGIDISPPLNHISGDQRFDIARDLAADYMTVLDTAYTALARFRARLSGCLSPLVLWAHHFDLAFLFFPGARMDEHKEPHLAFGFAPRSPGLDRPYFYAYGWSPSAGYLQLPASLPARQESEGYTGHYLGYDDLNGALRLDSQIEKVFCDYFLLANAKL